MPRSASPHPARDEWHPGRDRQNPGGSRQTQAESAKPKWISASPGRDPTVNHHAPRLDRDRSPLPTTTPRSRSEPVLPTNQTESRESRGVSGEQRRKWNEERERNRLKWNNGKKKNLNSGGVRNIFLMKREQLKSLPYFLKNETLLCILGFFFVF